METETVARNLKAARVKAGLNQEEAAKVLGISRQTMCNWENNANTLTLEKLNMLSKAYGCDPISFLMD